MRRTISALTRVALLPFAAAAVLWAGVASAATWTPATAADFTNALNNSALGDTIVLQAGTTYTGSFTLPNKPAGSGYVTIQSSALASLPAVGTRVTAAHAANMPRIQMANAFASAIGTAPGAHHYKLIGLQVVGPTVDTQPDGVSNITWPIIRLGDGGPNQDTLAEVPNNIIIDRCLVRANSATQRLKVGITINSASTDITNSTVSGIHAVGQDCQAVAGYNGPGPFNIINNYLEGSTENFMLGGGDPTIPNLVPSDLVFKRNHLFKPLSWKIGHPTHDGINWSVKNIFELKNARNCTVEENIFENNWVMGQDGTAILFTVRNQDGNAPWCIVENVTFKNNILRATSNAFSILGIDNNHPSGMANRIFVENNLIYDVGQSMGGAGHLYRIAAETNQMTFKHNTAFHTGNVLGPDGIQGAHDNFAWSDNIHAHNAYGVIGSNHGIGNDSLNYFFSTPKVFTKNVLMGGNANLYNQYAGNFFPASWSGVLVNQANPGPNFAGWKVVTGSAYDNSGTDGKDIGADIDLINTLTAGCISGAWGGGGGGTTTVVLKNGVNGYTGANSFHVSGQNPTTNFGASDYKHVANQLSGANGYIYRPFYKFDLSQGANAIPAGASIQSATLRVKIEFSFAGTSPNLSVHRVKPVNNAFTVNYATATRNTYNGSSAWTGGANSGGDVANSNNDFLDSPDATGAMPADGNYMDFNVTTSVQAWVNGETNNGWLFIPAERTVYMGTTSDLHGSADNAQLTVVYNSAPPSVTKVLKNGVNGYTGATSFYVSGQSPTTHHGASDYKQVANHLPGANGYVYRPFYKFDLTQGANAIPANAVIESATLKVKIEYSAGSTDAGIKIHRAKPVNNAFTINYATATRNTYNGASAWTGGANAGGDAADANNDFIDTPDATGTLPADGNYMTVNVTSAVQAWVNGEPNNGWLWITNGRTVYMGTPADLHGPGDYPELTITYH